MSSIDAIVAAVYDVISGPAGQKRDWEAETPRTPLLKKYLKSGD